MYIGARNLNSEVGEFSGLAYPSAPASFLLRFLWLWLFRRAGFLFRLLLLMVSKWLQHSSHHTKHPSVHHGEDVLLSKQDELDEL